MFASTLTRTVARRVATAARPGFATVRCASTIPEATVLGPGGADTINTAEYFGGKKVVLVGVVGAFTSTCDSQVPGFAGAIDDFKAKGVDSVAVVTVNDPLVVEAWKNKLAIDDEVTFMADWDASFTKALGQDVDLSVVGLGTRSLRYAMVVDDGKIVDTAVEESPGELNVSSAEATLGRL